MLFIDDVDNVDAVNNVDAIDNMHAVLLCRGLEVRDCWRLPSPEACSTTTITSLVWAQPVGERGKEEEGEIGEDTLLLGVGGFSVMIWCVDLLMVYSSGV